MSWCSATAVGVDALALAVETLSTLSDGSSSSSQGGTGVQTQTVPLDG
jgi:hypothetical protein